MATLEMSPNTERAFQDAFDTDDEYCLALLVKREEGDRLITVQFDISLGGANSTSIQNVMGPYIPKVRENPEVYEVIPGHAHSRAYGNMVQPYDPYWTVPQGEGLVPGTIVDGRFFVGGNGANRGDSAAFESLHRNFGRITGAHINRSLFVHARPGSEGQQMRRDLVQLTAYEFDPTARFKVREIPVVIR